MNDIYRYGGTINTLRPKPRFIVENTDLVDDTSGNYIQSSKDPSRKIPMVDQMVQDYKESRSLFERLWRGNLFREKQIVRNVLCKEYKLDETPEEFWERQNIPTFDEFMKDKENK